MKKRFAFILAGILFLAISVLMPSCKEEIYTDEEALAAMKEGLKYKNDLQKELAALNLTNELQLLNLQSQLSIKEMKVSDSLARVGTKTVLSIVVKDVTGMTSDMTGFSVSVNQSGVMKTLTTDANGLVVFPDCISGYATFVVTKTGFARATGVLQIWGADYYKETTQQAIFVPVFPTDGPVAKISGTLTAQLDMLTEAKELFPGGVVSLNFDDIRDAFDLPNSDLDPDFGIIGIVYDGGFMESVKTGTDGKYEFKVPKTKNQIEYRLAVSTVQKKQKLLYGGSQYLYNTNKLDTMRVDSLATFFGYWPWYSYPVNDYIGYTYNYGNGATFPGVNLTIDPPSGPNTPTSAASIGWAHNDSTVVTWSFTKFSYNSNNEWTRITQAPVFVYTPYDKTKVTVVTPTAGVVDITNGKLNSLYMTNGGVYKEYGRSFSPNGTVAPTQAQAPVFKFFEQLATEDMVNWAKDTTYQTALAVNAAPVLNQGKVKVPFTVNRKGKGYTAKPNAEFKLRIQTPGTGSGDTGDGGTDSTYTYNLSVNLTATKVMSIDTLVLPSTVTKIAQVHVLQSPIISTVLYANSNIWLTQGNYGPINIDATTTWKVDLTNGLKIYDGGLGYPTAPKVRIQNYARKEGTTGSHVLQTIAEAPTTLDAEGRIINVGDPVMLSNFQIQSNSFWNGTYNEYRFNTTNSVSVPAEVNGQVQAYARAVVDMYGTITGVMLYNEDVNNNEWFSNAYLGSNYVSGKGYLTIPKIKVTPVGLTTVAKPAVLQAVVNSAGRISNILIVDGGKGYTVRNDPKASEEPDYLVNWIYTNGSSDIVYNIDLGTGWHGNPIEIFDWDD